MIQFTPSQITLLNILGDGACHSGSALGHALGITRSAIWKQINQLIDFGIPIKSLPQQGYQLPNKLILLDEQRMAEHLVVHNLATPFNLHLFTSIDSTNRFLKDLPVSNRLDVCCAEIQTQGRGRFGRQWHSPFGENIYCSSRWDLNYDHQISK
jgi:BirA family biotin operon repressor/biotin-[acetyl-CoA-carboxylase] ligase